MPKRRSPTLAELFRSMRKNRPKRTYSRLYLWAGSCQSADVGRTSYGYGFDIFVSAESNDQAPI